MSAQRSALVSACVPGVVVIGVAGVVNTGDPIAQLNHFPTGFDELGVPLVIPSIDPAGITYHDPSGHLFISDSEINEVDEVFDVIGANIFEVSLNGDTLYASHDLTALGNNEPTGITYNAFDDHFYVTNDDARTITRYAFTPGVGFAFDDDVNTQSTAGARDPEGITSDPASGLLYAIDGRDALILVYSYDEGGSGFDLLDILDLEALNGPSGMRGDPEGIAYDVDTGHLFVVSAPDEAVFEYTTAGIFVALYDLTGFAPPVVAVQGMTFAPTSEAGDNPLTQGLYIVDGGIDNNQDPQERDGAVYEGFVGTDNCGNGTIDPGEDCANCPQDVPCPPGTECVGGVCQPLCGNGVPDPGEDCANCPQDVPCQPDEECVGGVCQPLCGNGVPDPGEDCATCPQDVPCPPGEECVGGVCQPLCGNGVPDPGEDCANCPQDVPCPPGTACVDGMCEELCGNGVPDPGEDCANCPQDVPCPPGTECVNGMCELLCGNGEVDPGEDCDNCPQDVQCPPGTECVSGMCEPLCGNGVPDPGEDCANCPQDVPCGPDEECVGGVCRPLCGNGIPDPGEDCANCPQDVPCGPDEECVGGVCQPLCGNGVPDPGEDCANCPQDVPCPPGTACVDGMCEELCGNGVPDPGEDCANCPQDVPCPPGTSCVDGECRQECPWDLDGDGSVGVADLLQLLAAWGSDPGGPPDFDGDGFVGVTDLVALLGAWGECP
ncbi:MAG: hypothetical protein ACYS0G_04830 [Planctomycetota bacterium]|jgi:hypothetical protein